MHLVVSLLAKPLKIVRQINKESKVIFFIRIQLAIYLTNKLKKVVSQMEKSLQDNGLEGPIL